MSRSLPMGQSESQNESPKEGTMQVYNVRLGHACNSSSTHSIVPLAALGGTAHDEYTPGEFGWDHFTLASPEAKMQYLAAMLSGYEPTETEVERIKALTGVGPIGSEWHGPFGYVDHQSVMSLPSGRHADEFVADLAAYLRRDDVVILGGNDNGGRGRAAHLPIPDWGQVKMRPGTAPDGTKYWTMMGRRGDRIRFSFHGQPLSGPGDDEYGLPPVEAEPLDVPYANAPELVDMKVTGYCPFEKDCPWCYMGSTRQGKHASLKTAGAWLEAFAAAEVFEIALGGGEPTLWPHLHDFMARASEFGIHVNLTTKNIAWLKPGALNGLGAVAVSINNRRDLDRFTAVDLAALDDGDVWPRPEVTVQCVPAFCDDELLADIIAAAQERGLRVTFLGVKRTGRAAEEKRQDDLRWLKLLEPYRGDWWLRRGVAVDTLMAAAAAPEFERIGISPVWYEVTEGKFSCYVDATTGQLAASSYAPPEQFVKATPELFVESFQAAQIEAGVRA